MPALAAIVNQAVPDEQNINLFYNTSTAQLAVGIKSGSKSKDPDSDYWASGDDDYKGYILNPSEIATARYNGIDFVAAATLPETEKDVEPTVNQISLIAPIYQKLTNTSLANNKIAMSSSADTAWIYFLSGANQGETRLSEYNLQTGNTSAYLKFQGVLLNSSLAAWYEPTTGERLVLFQEVDQGHIVQYNVDQNQTHNITTTTDAKTLTSITATFFENRVYAYYTDTHDNLRRIIRDEGGKWGSPENLDGSTKVGTSQLTVVTANRINHIFYDSLSVKKKNEFAHVRDPLPVPK